jgi:peptidoglycan/xylan/chitin deacetylase (PgdA/CDA1 family)
MPRIDQLPIAAPARKIYHCVRGLYRGGRAIGNRLGNLIDRPVIVLLYHRVVDLPADPEELSVSPQHFRQQLAYLRQHFRIVRFDEDWRQLQEPAVALTFDDGYADNLLEALPLLEEFEIPATFFINAEPLFSGQFFWWHRLEALLLDTGPYPARFKLKDSRYGRSWDTSSPELRQDLYARLGMRLRRLEPDRREDWLRQFEAWAGPNTQPPDQRHRALTSSEVTQLAASPQATIGAHTVTHTALSALPLAQQREEIFSSKAVLEKLLGKPVTTFSYPYGRKCEFNRASRELCREAGFLRAAANFPGQVHRWTDPMQIPRHLVRNWDGETFVQKLKGFWTG